jgi:hypothetical protein
MTPEFSGDAQLTLSMWKFSVNNELEFLFIAFGLPDELFASHYEIFVFLVVFLLQILS